MYIKISSKSSINYNINNNISLFLEENQQIINMQVMDKKTILIVIKSNNEIQGIVFDIDKQEIIKKIKK